MLSEKQELEAAIKFLTARELWDELSPGEKLLLKQSQNKYNDILAKENIRKKPSVRRGNEHNREGL